MCTIQTYTLLEFEPHIRKKLGGTQLVGCCVRYISSQMLFLSWAIGVGLLV